VGPKRLYYYGGSGHPQRVVTLTVSDAVVTFVTPPSRTVQTDRAAMFVALATRGTQVALKSGWGTAAERKGWEQALAGKLPPMVDPADYEQVGVIVVPAPGADFSKERGGDAWYAAEAYGGVAGVDVEGQQGYEIDMERQGLAKLRGDKRFKVVKVVERRTP
jgi:hypothetical protein